MAKKRMPEPKVIRPDDIDPHHDWKRMLPEYRRVILNKLKTTGQMPDIEDRIVYESALTPQDTPSRCRP